MKNKEYTTVDHFRNKGKEYCSKTKGSEHYVNIRNKRGIDPIEISIQNGRFEDFAVTNITKYAERFTETRNPKDLMKVADYAHILCGIELDKMEQQDAMIPNEEDEIRMQRGEI